MSDQPAVAAKKLRLPSISGPVLGLAIVLALFIILIGFKDPTQLKGFLGPRNLQVLLLECTAVPPDISQDQCF